MPRSLCLIHYCGYIRCTCVIIIPIGLSSNRYPLYFSPILQKGTSDHLEALNKTWSHQKKPRQIRLHWHHWIQCGDFFVLLMTLLKLSVRGANFTPNSHNMMNNVAVTFIAGGGVPHFYFLSSKQQLKLYVVTVDALMTPHQIWDRYPSLGTSDHLNQL